MEIDRRTISPIEILFTNFYYVHIIFDLRILCIISHFHGIYKFPSSFVNVRTLVKFCNSLSNPDKIAFGIERGSNIDHYDHPWLNCENISLWSTNVLIVERKNEVILYITYCTHYFLWQMLFLLSSFHGLAINNIMIDSKWQELY